MNSSAHRKSGAGFSLRVSFFLFSSLCCASVEQLPVRVSWGHNLPGSRNLQVIAGDRLETPQLEESANGVQFVLAFPRDTGPRLQNIHTLWADLIAASDIDTARRLANDASMDPSSPRLFIRTSKDGTRGFAVTVAQLKR